MSIRNHFKQFHQTLLCWWWVCGLSQAAAYHDHQTWLNFTSTGELYAGGEQFNRILLWLEGQTRYGNDSSHLSQQLARTGLGYGLTKRSSLWFGYAWINTRQPFTQNPFNEHRLWQQWLWHKSYPRATLLARIRTEQRSVKNYDKTAYRIRGLTKVIYPLNTNWSAVASNELFWHKNNFIGNNGKGFDQNRLFIGFGYTLAPNTVVTEIGYMNQAIRRFGIPNFINNILSLNLYVNW